MLFYLQKDEGKPKKTSEKLQNSGSQKNHIKRKKKQKQHFLGYSFSAVTECKKYCDESSPLLVYSVNENGEQVFKISALKMKIAKKKNGLQR